MLKDGADSEKSIKKDTKKEFESTQSNLPNL
jgi:hypothetical protein